MNVIRRNLLEGLLVILGGLYVYVGVYEIGVARFAGILGGLIIVAATVVGRRSRPIAGSLLLVGTLPLAIATWWSVVTPLVAVLALLLGGNILFTQPRASDAKRL
ncbi:MAG TPA: hypothetical protein VII89_01565 [Candidatus Dormibacteraeota bacterium]